MERGKFATKGAPGATAGISGGSKTREKAEKLKETGGRGKNIISSPEYTSGFGKLLDEGQWDPRSSMHGSWIKKDADDEYMNRLAEMPTVGAMGVKLAPTDRVVDYLRRQEDKAYQASYFDFVARNIDATRPDTQRETYDAVPELYDVPKEKMEQNVWLNVALWSIMESGTPSGPEDFQFLFGLMRDDVEIPMFPVWDTKGQVMYEILGDVNLNTFMKSYASGASDGKRENFFRAFKYANSENIGGENGKLYSSIQRKINAQILKRTINSFRHMTLSDIELYIAKLNQNISGASKLLSKNQNNLADPFYRPVKADVEKDANYSFGRYLRGDAV